MHIILTLIALAFPTVEGYLSLRILEGKNPVLWNIERVCAGFLLGCSLSGFIIFFAVLLGVPLTFVGFLWIHIVIIAFLLVIFIKLKKKKKIGKKIECDLLVQAKNLKKIPLWLKIIIFWLVIWTALKVFAGGYDILHAPSYWDDNYANWNMRAQVMYTEQNLMLHLNPNNPLYFGGRAAGYPMTAYITRIWIAMVNGEWSDEVVNNVSFLWFISFLTIFFCSLYRTFRRDKKSKHALVWTIFGVYVLVSLPLYLVHGTNPYIDVFMSGCLFMVLYWLLEWMQSKGNDSNSWLNILGFAAAMMAYVKNEAILIFLPPLLLLFVAASWRKIPTLIGRVQSMFRAVFPALLVVIPWSIFKITHGLGFANNKSVGGVLDFVPDPYVPSAIFHDLMYTGSFSILFPLFLLIIFMSWNIWKKSYIGMLVIFLLIVFVGEFCIYWFTDLATEALQHTGFGRGMIHIVPLIVFVGLWLIREIIGDKESG
jgi:hypothetical protein